MRRPRSSTPARQESPNQNDERETFWRLFDELQAQVNTYRLEFANRLQIWEEEHRTWFSERRSEIDGRVLKALHRYTLPLLALLYAPGAIGGWFLISNVKDLRDRSERTIALNDSIRREFSRSRDSLHLELEKARTLADAQQTLLAQYESGYFATLRETSNLQGNVAGQIAEAERARRQAAGAFSSLDSARLRLAASSDTLVGRLGQHDTTLQRVNGDLAQLHSTVGVLADRARLGQTVRVQSRKRTDIRGTTLSVWYEMDHGRVHHFTVFRVGERMVERPELLAGESVLVRVGEVRYRFTLRTTHTSLGGNSAEFEMETLALDNTTLR